MDFDERIILILSLAPYIQPELLDIFLIKNDNLNSGFTQVGGIKGKHHAGFIPTGETAAFILAANNLENRFGIAEIFGKEHIFYKHKILQLEPVAAIEPFLSGALHISTAYLHLFTGGSTYQPDYGIHFPAKKITTDMDWSDLVLAEHTLNEVMEIRDWINHGDNLLSDREMKKRIKPGYRAVFYGSPGTGKTLTASLLGKAADLDVYRINLSVVASTNMVETERNIAAVFDYAESKKCLLFFDEADALFGKRTQIQNSNDRYANLEIAYLLQRIEDYPGVIILSTNLKSNLDEALTRRFQNIIYFAKPDIEQRKRLWQNSFSDKTLLEDKIDLHNISSQYELTGASINNIVRFASLMTMKRGDNVILLKDLLQGIRKEFEKNGKAL